MTAWSPDSTRIRLRILRRILKSAAPLTAALAVAPAILPPAWPTSAAAQAVEREAEDSAQALAAEQARLASGEDLGPRARQVLQRARNRQDEGKFAEAASILQSWLDGDPGRDHHLLRYELAVNLAAAGDQVAALASLRAAVALQPRFGVAWLRLGQTAYALSQYEPAGEAFLEGYGLTVDPAPDILHYAGVSLLLAGQADRASRTLQTLLREHRQGAPTEWYRALVAAALESADPEAARPFLDALLADRAESADAWELACRFSTARQDYRAAAVMLTVAGYLRPLTETEWRQLGDLYAAIAVPLEAARCYQRALDLDLAAAPTGSGRSAEYERLATAWLAAHRHDLGRAALQAGLAAEPTARLWSLLGDLEFMQGEHEAALAAFGRACALDPDFGRGWLMMGYCALELDRPQDARGHLARAAGFPDQAAGAEAMLRRITP